jgi:hypothetical protein
MLLKSKILALALIVSAGIVLIYSCQKEGGGKNQSNNNNNNNDTTQKAAPAPTVSVTTSPLTVLLPNNCQQSFTITNTGPAGSTLNYTVADDGALSGFLNFSPSAGVLGPGNSVTISVNIKPAFINANPSLVGSSLVLNVYTPKASNLVKVPVPIKVKGISSIAPLFIGTWAGTWTGASQGANNPNQTPPSAPVNGTWTLNLTSIDTVGLTAAGSLTWDGTDVYWTYTYDKNGLIITATPNAFIPNRTIQFDATNTTFSYNTSANGCSQSEIHLTISGFLNQPNPSDAFYGPWFSANFDIGANTVTTAGNGFSTHPYAPVTFATFVSSGTVTGKKQ